MDGVKQRQGVGGPILYYFLWHRGNVCQNFVSTCKSFALPLFSLISSATDRSIGGV